MLDRVNIIRMLPMAPWWWDWWRLISLEVLQELTRCRWSFWVTSFCQKVLYVEIKYCIVYIFIGTAMSIVGSKHNVDYDMVMTILTTDDNLFCCMIIRDFSFQERLRILERETRLLMAFSNECFDLEEAYVTRHGGECGVPNNKR